MSVEEQPEATTRSYKLNALFFRRLYTLSAPYWCRREAWKAWAIMAMQLSSAAAFSLVGGYLSNLVADSTNALVAKQSIYWRIMIWMTFVGLMQTLAMQVTSWFSAWLLLDVLNQLWKVASSIFRATAIRNVKCADEVLVAVGRVQL